MLGTLLVVMTVFVFVREPAIDKMPRRKRGKRGFWAGIWEALSAYSHYPAYPAEIAVSSKPESISFSESEVISWSELAVLDSDEAKI